MSIKRRLKALEKISGQQSEMTAEEMAERCRYIEERLFNVKRLASDEPIKLFDVKLFDDEGDAENE